MFCLLDDPQSPSSTTVHSLPVELLSRIFLFGFSDGIDPTRPFKRKDVEPFPPFEVLVSHVCSHWRNIAINLTPGLWTTIRLRRPTHFHRGNEYVRRSGRKLLDVMMDTVGPNLYEEGRRLGIKEFDTAFDFAHNNSRRMRSFICKVTDLVCKQRARDRLHDLPAVPNLETLQLYHLQMWEAEDSLVNQTTRPPVLVVRYETKSLVNLSLIGVNLAWSLDRTPYLAGLKHLELGLHAANVRPSPDEWENILRKCPDLERLHLHYSGPRVAGIWEIKPIHLPRLVELRLNEVDMDVLIAIRRNHTFPNLEYFSLEFSEDDETGEFPDATPFMEMLSQKGTYDMPGLRRLRLASVECEAPVWKAFLQTIPSVTELEVVGDLMDRFLGVLVEPSQPENGHDGDASHPSSDKSPSPPESALSSLALRHPVFLPQLSTLKVASLPASVVQTFLAAREKMGYPVSTVLASRKSYDSISKGLKLAGELGYYSQSEEDSDTEDGFMGTADDYSSQEDGENDNDGDDEGTVDGEGDR